ncbi:hypothetical protein [Fontivita pretiosa]|uniref:hypothetical protein n=1 Tax=Fontivita pretiosa TaxID=2989684 RepID=UPI003D166707
MTDVPIGADESDRRLHRLRLLLDRPIEQRVREYKYRFAQAMIFGLPVLGLQWVGNRLGGTAEEAERWVAVLQALMGGWVVYLSATGMLVEQVLLMSRPARPSSRAWCGRRNIPELLVCVFAVALTLFSLLSVTGVFATGRPFYRPLLFHWAVMLLAGWCGLRWWMLWRSSSRPPSDSKTMPQL